MVDDEHGLILALEGGGCLVERDWMVLEGHESSGIRRQRFGGDRKRLSMGFGTVGNPVSRPQF